MLVCPVCNHHQQEVSNCQRCNWSIQKDLEISPEHPILTTCIPTLVESLTNKIAQYEKLSLILQDIDLQESNNRKLDEIQEQFVDFKKTINDKIIKKLDFLAQIEEASYDVISKEKDEQSNLDSNASQTKYIESPDILIEDNSESLTHHYTEQSNPVSLPPFLNSNNLQFINSDCNINNGFNLTDELQEDSLYNLSSDRNIDDNFGSINIGTSNLNDSPDNLEHIETINPSENTDPETNSYNSYQGFYRLIEQQEIEVTKVAVTQETMEKMRGGTHSKLEFSNDRRGNYLIINWQDVYCLIPKEKLNINQYQYGNFQRIFNCQDYKEIYQDFEVIEPATVISCDREIWQLDRKGEIKFI